jgi:replicative DNA helicase
MDPDCLMSSIYTITDNQLYQEKFQLFDVGAERSLLALLIKEPDMMAISDQTVPDSYFNLDVNGYIYKVMRFQYKNAITHGWPISFTAQALAAVARQCGPGFEQSLYKKTNNLSSIRDLEVLSQSSKKDDFATLRATLADRAARVAYYDHCRRIQKMALDVGTNADVNSIHDENTAFTSFQQAGDESDSSDHKMALLGDASDDWSLDIEMNKRYGHQGVTSTHVNHLPFLMQRLGGGWRNGGLHVLAARPKVGKALSMNSKLLTPTGWIRMAEVLVGDKIAGSKGEFCTVTGVFPQGSKYLYDVVFKDGAKVRCCGEHLWFTRSQFERKHGEAGSVKTTREIIRTLKTGSDDRYNHAVPFVNPVEMEYRDLPVHPYVLGVLIGDGDLTGSTLRVHKPERCIWDMVEALLPDGDEVVRNAERGYFSIVRPGTREPSRTRDGIEQVGLRGLCSHEKFVPSEYMIGSVYQRTMLLRGMLDTDGHVMRNGSGVEFSTSSERIAISVVELVQSLGGIATIHKRITTYTANGQKRDGLDAHRIIIYMPSGIIPVSSEKHLSRWKGWNDSSQRTIVAVEPVGIEDCQCITVDAADKLFVTDGCVLTHNSTFLLWQAITAAVEQNIPVLYLDTEMSRKEMFSRAMSRLTGHFEQDLLIGKFMDEGGSHEPIVAEAIYMLKHSQFVYKNIAGERPDQIPVHFRQFRRNFVGDRVLTGYSGKEYTFAKQALVLYDWIKVGSASDLGRNVAEYQQLGFIATMLKYSASSNYLPVIAGAQNNREAIQKKGGPPVDFEESGESMVSGSDRLAQFCSTLMGLRNVTNKEAELITAKFSIRDSTEHDHPQHKLAYNQVLHVYLARAGSNWTKGVPLYMNRGKATYEEMVYTAAGVDTGIKQFMFDIKDKAKQPNTEKAKFTTVATTSSETVPTNPSEAIPM